MDCSTCNEIVVSVCVMLHRKKRFVAPKRAKLAGTNCSVLARRNDPCYHSYSEDIEERTTRIDVSSVLVEKWINYCGGKLRSRWKLYHKWD